MFGHTLNSSASEREKHLSIKNSSTMNIAVISEILETYEGRDKFLKTLSYAAKLATGFTNSSETTKKFKHFGSRMSECRVILRLLDDIPALHDIITFGWGKQEPDKTARWLKLLRNALDFVSSPVEHICWLGEQKLVKTNENFWDNLSTVLWIACLYLSVMISLRKLGEINTRIEDAVCNADSGTCQEDEKRKENLYIQGRNQLLTCTRLCLDLSYAISYLPPGNLWGGYLKTWQVGALGTLSSVIGLYQVFKSHLQSQQESCSSSLACS